MNVTVNGKRLSIKAESVQDLIQELNLTGKHLVVELNEHILKRENWKHSFLKENDKIEIIQFVAGG